MTVRMNNNVLDQLRQEMGRRLEKAAIHLVNKIREKINRSQPYRRYVGRKGIYYKGLNPSNPGEPPKVLTGQLKRSIAYEMASDRLSVRIGTNLKYAGWLEFGTRNMLARPYFRATLNQEQATLAGILGRRI